MSQHLSRVGRQSSDHRLFKAPTSSSLWLLHFPEPQPARCGWEREKADDAWGVLHLGRCLLYHSCPHSIGCQSHDATEPQGQLGNMLCVPRNRMHSTASTAPRFPKRILSLWDAFQDSPEMPQEMTACLLQRTSSLIGCLTFVLGLGPLPLLWSHYPSRKILLDGAQ